MKRKLLDYLSCTACSGRLQLAKIDEEQSDEIMSGQLACGSCQREVPVTGGIPRFATPEKVESEKAATAENFGWQWQHFTQTDELYAEQFLHWIAPVTPEFFKGKLVLEGGCGKGRHTQLAAKWGASEVVGVDLSAAVETAFAATRHLPNVHIVQADIYNLPLKPVFDYAFSVGVLHHLPEPRRGFRALAAKVRPEGQLSAWVYGAENNEWITRWVDPVRERCTSRINRRLLLHLSKLPTLLLYLGTKLIYGPLNRTNGGSRLASKLFYNDYLTAISKFGWREQHTIVFDHLVAPTSHYIPKEEFADWWREVKGTDVVIGWHNSNSWRGFGRV